MAPDTWKIFRKIAVNWDGTWEVDREKTPQHGLSGQISESLGLFSFKQKEYKESADATGQIHKHMLLKARSEAKQTDTI